MLNQQEDENAKVRYEDKINTIFFSIKPCSIIQTNFDKVNQLQHILYYISFHKKYYYYYLVGRN